MSEISRLSVICGIGALLVFCVLLFVPSAYPYGFQKFYADNLRGELFGGFLSLGGFLFALKTFIITTMKKELYDDPDYGIRYKEQRALDEKLRRYAPLNRLRVFLSATVIVSLLTAVFQLTIGFIPYWVAAYTCVSLAVYAMILMICSLIQMWVNLRDLLDYWEESSERSLKAEKKNKNNGVA